MTAKDREFTNRGNATYYVMLFSGVIEMIIGMIRNDQTIMFFGVGWVLVSFGFALYCMFKSLPSRYVYEKAKSVSNAA